LDGTSLAFLKEQPDSYPVYLRFPVVTDSPSKRDAVLARLSSAGLGASANYPTGIAEIPELAIPESQKKQCDAGNRLAKRILTLPTHPGITDEEQKKIVALLNEEMTDPASKLAYTESGI
jgi:dTDP-4-amino-4,6-dideoxygalactose transaminase